MQKLSIRWNVLLGIISLVISVFFWASPPAPTFLHLSIYSWPFTIIGAVFLGTASYKFGKKIKG